MYKEHYKKFYETYQCLATKYGKHTVFSDFVKICAISIYNSFANNEEMEQQYLKTINSYKKEDQNLFPKMFAHLMLMYQKANDIVDILGPFFEKEHLTSDNLGQFFTPTHISHFMSEVCIPSKEELEKIIKEKDFIVLDEYTCGAGRYDTFLC